MMDERDILRLADALAQRVAEIVVQRLRTEPGALVKKGDLCTALGFTPSQVDRYCRAGMPRERVKGMPRFNVAACRDWLDAHPQRSQPPAVKREPPGPPKVDVLDTVSFRVRGKRAA